MKTHLIHSKATAFMKAVGFGEAESAQQIDPVQDPLCFFMVADGCLEIILHPNVRKEIYETAVELKKALQ